MKAITFNAYGTCEQLRVEEVDKPTPTDNQVLVKVYAASLNDWDWGLLQGKPYFMRLFTGIFKPKIHVLGCDVAGRVDAVGKDVSRFRPGDEVFGDLSESGFGSFAEYVCAPASALERKPTNMTFEQAAGVPQAALLALQSLRDKVTIRRGQTILINGAGGGVGTYGLQMLKPQGVEVTAVDHGEKLAMLSSLGADHVIDYTKEDFTRSGRQYDLILDTKTSRSPFAHARALKPGGVYVTVGGSMVRVAQMLVLSRWIARTTGKHLRLLGLKANRYLDELRELIEAGTVSTVVDGPYPLSETPRAMEYFGNAQHLGKVVIQVQP